MWDGTVPRFFYQCHAIAVAQQAVEAGAIKAGEGLQPVEHTVRLEPMNTMLWHLKAPKGKPYPPPLFLLEGRDIGY